MIMSLTTMAVAASTAFFSVKANEFLHLAQEISNLVKPRMSLSTSYCKIGFLLPMIWISPSKALAWLYSYSLHLESALRSDVTVDNSDCSWLSSACSRAISRWIFSIQPCTTCCRCCLVLWTRSIA